MKPTILILLLTTVVRLSLAADCADSRNISLYIQCQALVEVNARAAKNGSGKQAEAPSLATNSSTFVDQSSAPDLFGVAFGLTGTSSPSTPNQGVAVSATAYAVASALRRQDPLDPSNYVKGAELRRLSFTLGNDVPDDATKPQGTKANIYGFKYLLYGSREPERVHNKQRTDMDAAVLNTAKDINSWKEIMDWLFETIKGRSASNATAAEKATFIVNELGDNWTMTLKSLTDRQKSDLDRRIAEKTMNLVATMEAVRTFVAAVRDAPQWSFEFLTKRRPNDAGNDYRAQLIFDRGVFSGRSLIIVNASGDYKDFKKIGADTRGGRVAVELRNRVLGLGLFSSSPLTVSFSGEAKWMTHSKPNYSAQGKIIVPLGMPGVELPISVTYSSQPIAGQTKDVVGKVSLTIDPAKVAGLFKP